MTVPRPTPRLLVVLAAAAAGLATATAFAATLQVGSWHLWAGAQTLTKGTCTVTGKASTVDTYVDQNKPGNQFGGGATMSVKPDAGAQQWSFIRFSLSACALPSSAGADSATLSLYLKSAPSQSRTLTLTPVSSTWAQTLTWTQAQSLGYGPATATFATGTANNTMLTVPVTVDVDALIKSPSAIYGWRIGDGGGAAAGATSTFNTSNAASNNPTLTISYAK